jgi:hypothetical protein
MQARHVLDLNFGASYNLTPSSKFRNTTQKTDTALWQSLEFMSVVPWSILNEVISPGNKNEYADTNMVRFDLYCGESKRPIR